jgi:hypothetical protein
MGKYKSYIFLGITLLVLLLVGYCVARNSKNNEKKELEINFVSDHPIAEVNSKIPNEISVFFDKFVLSEIKTEYENNISFRRIDLADNKSVSVSNNETTALPKMYLNKDNNNLDSYKNDTLNIVYYYLVSSNNVKNVDNIKIFNDVSLLREHIKTKLLDKSLFNNGEVLNRITVLLLSGEIKDLNIQQTQNEQQQVKQPPVETTKPTVNTVEQSVQVTQPTPKAIKIPEINVNLKVDDNNNVSWNPRLADSDINLSLIFERNGQIVENTDVSNQSSYTYLPGAEGDLKTTKVTLKVNGNVKTIGSNSLKTKAFTCTVH